MARWQYTIDELSIDVAAAVRAAGGTLLPAHVTGIDPRARTLTLADGNTVPYDVCSIAVGSQVSGKAIPGVAEHAVAVKPLAAIRTIGERLDALARSSGGQVVVVGGGMAGVELALALRTRANGVASRGAPAGTLEGTPGGQSVRVSLVSRDTVLASDRHPRVSRRLERVCEARGIELRLATTPVQLDAGRITLQHAGEQQRRRADLVVWATGGEAAPWLAASGLPVDARGFLLVDDRLQSVGDPRVFAAGDSASLASWPDTPKAGCTPCAWGRGWCSRWPTHSVMGRARTPIARSSGSWRWPTQGMERRWPRGGDWWPRDDGRCGGRTGSIVASCDGSRRLTACATHREPDAVLPASLDAFAISVPCRGC
ncbi:MAG: FAD-dependent oxidoreductase [Gemmatimonadetes bacterium]|nr:FAD-dependent oxidoreductase [Gemmatimonadota bacterium]